MKRVCVTGAGGFIGHHLVTFLKQEGYWVRGVDLKYPEYTEAAFVLKVLAHPPRLAQTPLGPSVAGGSEITPGASR